MKRLAPPHRYRTGFTLIELLVVIAIIAILAAMMMPVLSKARIRAMETECVSRTRQIGHGTTMFANENSGLYPARFANVTNGLKEGCTPGLWYGHVKD